MNPLAQFFVTIGKGLASVFKAAQKAGLTDAMLQLAANLVAQAATQPATTTATERREWVVGELVSTGLGENLARFAVEAAVVAYKDAHRPATPAPK